MKKLTHGIWLFNFYLLIFIISVAFAQSTYKELKDIKIDRQGIQLKILLVMEGKVEISKAQLVKENRLGLNVRSLEKISVASPLLVEDSQLKKIRIRVIDQENVLVEFEFKNKVPNFTASPVPEGHEIVFSAEAKESLSEVEPEIRPAIIIPPPPSSEIVSFGPRRIEMGFVSGINLVKDTVFQELYGHQMVFFRGEYAVVLPIPLETVDLWLGVCYSQKEGRSSYLEDRIKFKLWSFSYALRYLYTFSRISLYAGPGLDMVIYREEYPPEFLIPTTRGRDLGFHLQGGVHVYLLPSLALTLNLKYNFLKTEINQIEVDLGGLETGLGLRFGFGR